MLTLLEELAALNFIGMDCVEVAPPYDHAELTSNAAANFVWTYLSGRCAKRQEPRPGCAAHTSSAVVFFTVRRTSIEFKRATPGSRANTSL